jgi:hypothetical protein
MAETARVVDHTFGSPGVGTCLWPHMSESPDTFTFVVPPVSGELTAPPDEAEAAAFADAARASW